MKLTAIDLFAGGGGFSEAARQAGVQVVAAIERDPGVAAWYRANHGDHVRVADCLDTDYREWAGIDLLLASPPCQGASLARDRSLPAHPDKDAGLAAVRAIEQARPRWLILENVPQYQTEDAYSAIYGKLLQLGYQTRGLTVDFADYGIPQNRRRLLLIASRQGSIEMPEPTHMAQIAPTLPGFRQHRLWQGWYEAIVDLLPNCPECELAEWQVRELCDRGLCGARPLLISSTNQRSFPWRLGSHPAPTACTTHNTPIAIVATGYRRLSVRCMARFQGFPDSYQLPTTKPLGCKIVGNAVPPPAMALFIRALTQKGPAIPSEIPSEAALTKTV